MAIIKWRGKEWDPFRELLDLQNETERLLGSSMESLPERLSREAVWIPSMDVTEDENAVNIKMDIPGVKQPDVDVSISDNILIVKGTRKGEEETKNKKVHRLERFYGSFQRSLALPDYVDVSKIEASYKDGMLEIRIPKSEHVKPRQIKVEIK